MPGTKQILNIIISVINFLRHQDLTGYSFPAAAKSVAGRRNPSYLTATQHAPGVFFYVAALTHLYFMVWCSVLAICFLRHIIKIMVVQAGQLSGWPVSVRAGIPTPVWATTSFGRRNPGGSVTRYLTEVAIMAATPVFQHPQYSFLFLAIRRADYQAKPCRVRITASDEHSARIMLAPEYVLSFAGRLPVHANRKVTA